MSIINHNYLSNLHVYFASNYSHAIHYYHEITFLLQLSHSTHLDYKRRVNAAINHIH